MRMKVRNIDLMLVDAEHAAYRAYYVHTVPGHELMTSRGTLSGCFYGFFSILKKKIEEYGPKDLVVCWGDKTVNLKRRKIYPSYKLNRTTKPMDFVNQVEDIKYALYLMMIEQCYSPEYEADDVIATISNRFLDDSSGDVIILSGDKDMCQLVSDRVFVLNPKSGGKSQDVLLDREKVFEKFGVYPELLADYLTLLGDDTDNIPGVSGIGEKTATKILVENGPIRNWIQSIDMITASDKVKSSLKETVQQLFISKRLISLTHSSVDLKGVVDTNPYESADEIFDKYEMKKIRPEGLTLR